MNQQLLARIEHNYPVLYETPNGESIDFDRKNGVLTLHDAHDRDYLGVEIGPIGLIELASKLTAIAAEMLMKEDL